MAIDLLIREYAVRLLLLNPDHQFWVIFFPTCKNYFAAIAPVYRVALAALSPCSFEGKTSERYF